MKMMGIDILEHTERHLTLDEARQLYVSMLEEVESFVYLISPAQCYMFWRCYFLSSFLLVSLETNYYLRTYWLLVVIISIISSYLNVHFLRRKLCRKTVVRYVTLNPFDVNDDVIFLFTSYKQISAVILTPNIEVTSPTRCRYENFP